jgi:cytochrome c6
VQSNFTEEKTDMKPILMLVISLSIATATSVRAAEPKALWAANCAQCHGADGSANTKMGKQLNAKDLTSAQVQASFTDTDAAKAIKDGVKQNGKTTMKAFGGKLSEDDIKALVAYVRTLKK